MWPIKPKASKAEIIEHEETAIETIEVRDIRQYLVDEYERAASLKALCDKQAAKLEAADETSAKYQAALITLDEYSMRLKRQDAEIESLKSKIEKEREKARAERDEANVLRIRLNRMEPSMIADEARQKAAELLLAAKGSMSRKRAANIVLGKEPVLIEDCEE